jgi:hypothetical protein
MKRPLILRVQGQPLAMEMTDLSSPSQEFGQYNVSDITCPVVAIKATEDDLLGGQASHLHLGCKQRASLCLPSVARLSVKINALNCGSNS